MLYTTSVLRESLADDPRVASASSQARSQSTAVEAIAVLPLSRTMLCLAERPHPRRGSCSHHHEEHEPAPPNSTVRLADQRDIIDRHDFRAAPTWRGARSRVSTSASCFLILSPGARSSSRTTVMGYRDRGPSRVALLVTGMCWSGMGRCAGFVWLCYASSLKPRLHAMELS